MKTLRARRRPGLVTIVVPAKDEEEGIGATLRSLPVATLRAAGFDSEVVVLDGRSRDATAAVARSHGARVIPDREPGKGAAVRLARTEFRGAYVVMLDADGTYAADAIPLLLEPLARGEADVVMGIRTVLAGAMTPLHRAGNAALSLAARMLYGRPCKDVCTGMWGFRADALRALPLRASGFELEAEFFALASRLRLRVAAVPVDYRARTGRAKLSAVDGVLIAMSLLRSRFARIPAGPHFPRPARIPAGLPAPAPGLLARGLLEGVALFDPSAARAERSEAVEA